MNFACARASELPASTYDALARFRYDVFVTRMGWDLKTEVGYEQDQFDHADTVHIVATDAENAVLGCGRLLPTTANYLLESVFPELLNGLPAPCSESVWELSRFAASDSRAVEGGQPQFLAERVLLEALRFCSARRATHILAVSSIPAERLMHRAGVDVRRLGPPVLVGGQPILAFLIAVNEASISALEAFESAALHQTAKPSPLRRGRPEAVAIDGILLRQLGLAQQLASPAPVAMLAGSATVRSETLRVAVH